MVSNTEKVKAWYQKKKQDPNFYSEYKLKQKAYYEKRKQNPSFKEKKKIYNKKSNAIARAKIKLNKPPRIINCELCNKEFQAVTSRQKYCSKKCKKQQSYNNYYNELKADPVRYKKYLEKKNNTLKNNPERVKRKQEYLKKYQAEWKSKNKDKVQEWGREWKSKNKDKVQEWGREWRRKNKEKIKTYRKNYLLKPKTKEKQNIAIRRWKINKIKVDPIYRISERLRSYLSRSIKGQIKKPTKTEKIVGISYKELAKYLETKFKPGMTLTNYGEWHIDHIKPVTKFDLTKPGELEKCFHYTNLQPLWAKENIRKSNKY